MFMSTNTSSRNTSASTSSTSETEFTWTPLTNLGAMVLNGKITSLDEIFELGLKIKEAEIVKFLLPDIKTDIVKLGTVQKQTDAGELTRYKAVIAVGHTSGWFGLGKGKSKQMRVAIAKATNNAFINVIPVKLGSGSWESKNTSNNSIPYKTKANGGSVKIEIIPGPLGLGIVANKTVKSLLELTGIKDIWSKSSGSTSTLPSVAYAVYDALNNLHKFSKVPS